MRCRSSCRRHFFLCEELFRKKLKRKQVLFEFETLKIFECFSLFFFFFSSLVSSRYIKNLEFY